MFNCDFNGSMEIMVRNNINHDFWWKNPITCWNMLVEASLIHPCEEPKGSVWLVPCIWMIIKLSLCSDTWFLRVLNIFNPLNPFLGDQKKHPTIEKILCFLFKILMVIDICGLFTFQMTIAVRFCRTKRTAVPATARYYWPLSVATLLYFWAPRTLKSTTWIIIWLNHRLWRHSCYML